MAMAQNNCWAKVLGGCSEKMSGEHLISKNQFGNGKKITVGGFPWCRGGTKEIGINSATSNVLCRTHNSALSPTDTAAGKLLDAFELIAERDAEARRTARDTRSLGRYQRRLERVDVLILDEIGFGPSRLSTPPCS